MRKQKTLTPKLIAEFNKNSTEVIRVQLVKFENKGLLDIRVWVLKDGADYIPTRKGISLRFDLVDSLKEAIDKGAQELEKAQGQG